MTLRELIRQGKVWLKVRVRTVRVRKPPRKGETCTQSCDRFKNLEGMYYSKISQ